MSSDVRDTRVRILIVGQNDDQATIISRAMAPLATRYDLAFVDTCEQARELLAAAPHELVLTEMDLPDGKGTDLIVPTLHAGHGVVIVTSQGGAHAAVESMKAGALDFIVKTPEVLAGIPRIIERALREWDLVRERRTLEEQLRHSQKMDSIGHLAGGIAHDFSNLLTAIIGYTDMSLLDLEDHDSLSENLQQIRLAGERASQLTGQLLSFARKRILALRTINMNDLLMNLEKMLRRLIREDIELVILPGDELWPVKADPGLLEQVIVNMVVNARHAMPAGGKLTLETANLRLAEGEVNTHAGIKPGDYVVLTIADTGIGMSEEVQRHIFEPFFTTRERGQGTGLGLATSYGIVRQNEGHITFDSQLNKGTTFRIFLPRAAESPEIQACNAQSAAPRGSETILVVEDEAAVRGFTIKALNKLGYTVLEASGGPEALRLAAEYPGHIQLLMTDLVMPHMSGRTVAEEVALLRPGIRVLFTSGYTAGIPLSPTEPGQTVFFLQKPYTSTMLAQKVRATLDAH